MKIDHYVRIMLLFIAAYSLIVLSFQTYTITRYILPLLPFVYLLAANALVRLKVSYIVLSFVLLASIASLVSSNDPVSNVIWNKYQVFGDSFYIRKNDGFDGITYNMQFLFISRQRNDIIQRGEEKGKLNKLNIDAKTLSILDR
jgi:hypothetical protein